MMKYFLKIGLIALIISVALFAQSVVVDPLTGPVPALDGTRSVIGGTFSSTGWMVNASADKIIYNLNHPIAEFEAEFKIANVKAPGSRYSLKVPIFNIRDKASLGDYATAYENNYVDLWIRTDSWALKSLVRVTGMHEWSETNGPDLSWDPAKAYTIRLVWKDQVLRVYRDGDLHITDDMRSYGGGFASDQIFVGRHNRSGYDAPQYAVFSDLEVYIDKATTHVKMAQFAKRDRTSLPFARSNYIVDLTGRILATAHVGIENGRHFNAGPPGNGCYMQLVDKGTVQRLLAIAR